MLDRSHIDHAVEELAYSLADSPALSGHQARHFELSVLDIAETYGIGVTNVMGRVAQAIARSDRFTAAQENQLVHYLRDRGVGVAQPALRCF